MCDTLSRYLDSVLHMCGKYASHYGGTYTILNIGDDYCDHFVVMRMLQLHPVVQGARQMLRTTQGRTVVIVMPPLPAMKQMIALTQTNYKVSPLFSFCFVFY